jgi:hypothetical protein
MALLDRFIPHPDVRERFEVKVRAPAPLVMDVAVNFDMQSVPLARIIFRLREVFLGSTNRAERRPQGILDETTGVGWEVLDQRAGEFVVCGARCQPWLADVVFSPIGREAFLHYAEPGYVKIAWTLEAMQTQPHVTTLAQETRVLATDPASRLKFVRYWRWARFGIIAIRLLLLPAVRRAAEIRWNRGD